MTEEILDSYSSRIKKIHEGSEPGSTVDLQCQYLQSFLKRISNQKDKLEELEKRAVLLSDNLQKLKLEMQKLENPEQSES